MECSRAVEDKGGVVYLRVRVQPKASRNEIRQEPDGRVRVALTSPPVEGAANKALVELVAKSLGAAKSAVSVVTGEKSREKVLSISGFTADEVVEKLGLR